VVWVDDDGTTRLGERPVTLTTLSNEVEAIAPKARVY
jgi:hypothetical protein